jgi:hypothetical protein
MDICLMSFTKIVSQPESINIAGIHATLLAIMIACLSAYVLFRFENVITFQMRAIKEAEKINEINFITYLHGRLEQEDDVWNKNKMVQTLSDIMQGHDDRSLKIETRATRALGIMSAIVNQYPFCNRFFKPKPEDGHFGSRGIPDPIIFGDSEDVRKWVKEIDDITGSLISIWTINNYSENLVNIMEEFSNTEMLISNKKTMTKMAAMISDINIYTPVAIDPLSSCNDFFSKLIESRKIMNKAKYFIQQTDSFREKVSSVIFLCIALVMIGVIFIVGVIFPLTWPSVNSVYLLWIPFMFYGTVYLYLIFKIFKIITMK